MVAPCVSPLAPQQQTLSTRSDLRPTLFSLQQMGNKRSRTTGRNQQQSASTTGSVINLAGEADPVVPVVASNADSSGLQQGQGRSSVPAPREHHLGDDDLQSLPIELLNVIVNNLSPRERRPLRLASKYWCQVVNKTAETLTGESLYTVGAGYWCGLRRHPPDCCRIPPPLRSVQRYGAVHHQRRARVHLPPNRGCDIHV